MFSRQGRSWPRAVRLRTRREFVAVQQRGRRVAGRYFVALVAPAQGAHGRIGITVSKRVGNAVTRNRVKRWVREAVRQAADGVWLPRDTDVVIVAKASAARAPGFAAIAADLADIGRRA
ncbi:MAG: ribonuclease P protein component [Deltaproteobacteria bacterium]|nr:MAG: ribonuclease P protein component [Deltaproteobacteria bacterium]